MITFCCNCSASREFEDNVCTGCGLEIKEDKLENQTLYDSNYNENNNFSTNKRPFYLITSKYDGYLCYLRPLRNLTIYVCKALKCASHVQKGSLAWVEKVFQHERFRIIRKPNKRVLCLVVVYLVSRSWQVAITMSDLKKALPEVYFKNFGKWKFIVSNHFPDLAKFGVAMTKIEIANNKCDIMKLSLTCRQKVHDLLGLLDKLWVCEGVGSESLVVACCYVGWMAESPIERIKTTFESFCRLHDVAIKPTLKNNYVVILTSLNYLHQKLPWVNNEEMDNNGNNNNKIKSKKNNKNGIEENKGIYASNYFINESIENKTNCFSAKVNKEIFFHLDDIIMYGGVSVDDDDDEDDDDEDDDDDDDYEEDDEYSDVDDDDDNNNNEDKINNMENKICYNDKINNKNNKTATENMATSNNNNVISRHCYNDNKELSVVADELLKWRRWKRNKNTHDDGDDDDDAVNHTIIPSTTDLYREDINECDMSEGELQSYLKSSAEVCAIKRIKKYSKKRTL